MSREDPPLKKAVVEAAINGIVIFSLSMGLAGFAKTSTPYISSEVSFTFLMLQSFFLALIRFATYLLDKDNRVSAGEIGNIIGYENNTGHFRTFVTRHKIGKVI